MDDKFWNDKLSNDEKLVYSFGIGKGYINFMIGLMSLISVILLILCIWINSVPDFNIDLYIIIFPIALFIVSFIYFKYYLPASHKYALTDKRVMIKDGWINSKLVSIDYESVTDMEIFESILNKAITKTASIKLNTAGGDTMEGMLKYVQNPYEIKKQISELTEEYRNKNNAEVKDSQPIETLEQLQTK